MFSRTQSGLHNCIHVNAEKILRAMLSHALKNSEIELRTGSLSMNLMVLQSKAMTQAFKPLVGVPFLGMCFVRQESLQLNLTL